MALNEDERAELVAYLDGELDEAETQAIEAKIATDPDARAELDALQQTWGMLDYLPKATPSPNFTNKTLERLTLEDVSAQQVKPTRSPWPVAIGWAAAVVAAVGLGYGTMAFMWPTPIPNADRELVENLRVVENWRLYENADDLEFVKKLDHPDLFGDDPS
jgi:anti-sigma factor RsiW